jgi:ankyrin repeat protein
MVRLAAFPKISCENGSADDISLFMACAIGHVDRVRSLMAQYDNNAAALNQRSKNTLSKGAAPLFVACFYGNTDCVSALLKSPLVDVNMTYFGHTPLLIACHQNRVECVRLLLENERTDLNQQNKRGYSPLSASCDSGNFECIAILIEKGGDRIDINRTQENGMAPLHVACSHGNTECVNVLLDKADERVDVNHMTANHGSALLTALSRKHKGCVDALIKKAGHRLDVNSGNDYWASPLIAAIEHSTIACIDLLMDHRRLDINKTSIKGNSPLIIACGMLDPSAAYLLIEKSGESINVNHRNDKDETALHYLCLFDREDLALRLLNLGADCNIRNTQVVAIKKSDSDKYSFFFKKKQGRKPAYRANSTGSKVKSYEYRRRLLVLLLACRRRSIPILWMPIELYVFIFDEYLL